MRSCKKPLHCLYVGGGVLQVDYYDYDDDDFDSQLPREGRYDSHLRMWKLRHGNCITCPKPHSQEATFLVCLALKSLSFPSEHT